MGSSKDQQQEGIVLELGRRPRVNSKIDRIASYWNSVRGTRLVPSRCEIDPRGLDGILGHAFILERITGGLARFRIAGSHLTELTGLELRQMPLSALFLPSSREILADALEAVFDEPAIVRMGISSPGGFGRPPLQGELILLPLRSDLGDIDRVLGGIVFEGRIGRSQRRIEIVSQSRKSLTGYAGPMHSGLRPERLNPATPMRTESTGLLPHDRRIARGHLRLVVSNE